MNICLMGDFDSGSPFLIPPFLRGVRGDLGVRGDRWNFYCIGNICFVGNQEFEPFGEPKRGTWIVPNLLRFTFWPHT